MLREKCQKKSWGWISGQKQGNQRASGKNSIAKYSAWNNERKCLVREIMDEIGTSKIDGSYTRTILRENQKNT